MVSGATNTAGSLLLASSQYAMSVPEPSQVLSGVSGGSQLPIWFSGASEPMDLDAAEIMNPQLAHVMGSALRASEDGSVPVAAAITVEAAPAKRGVLQQLSANAGPAAATLDKLKPRTTRTISVAVAPTITADDAENSRPAEIAGPGGAAGRTTRPRSLLGKLQQQSSSQATVSGVVPPGQATACVATRASRMPR